MIIDIDTRHNIIRVNNKEWDPAEHPRKEDGEFAKKGTGTTGISGDGFDDDKEPEYTGETIEIDGKERTVYNSNGNRLAKSEQGLRNFYNWFGDSKVVDEQGRPLVVHHGTSAEFDTFDIEKARDGQYKKGFFFTADKAAARMFGNIIMPVYLKAETDFYESKRTGKPIDYIHPKNDSRNIWIVFDNKQIKSVNNRGTYSPDTANINNCYKRNNIMKRITTINIDTVNRTIHVNNEFDESKHKRDSDGKFTSGGGASKGTSDKTGTKQEYDKKHSTASQYTKKEWDETEPVVEEPRYKYAKSKTPLTGKQLIDKGWSPIAYSGTTIPEEKDSFHPYWLTKGEFQQIKISKEEYQKLHKYSWDKTVEWAKKMRGENGKV